MGAALVSCALLMKYSTNTIDNKIKTAKNKKLSYTKWRHCANATPMQQKTTYRDFLSRKQRETTTICNIFISNFFHCSYLVLLDNSFFLTNTILFKQIFDLMARLCFESTYYPTKDTNYYISSDNFIVQIREESCLTCESKGYVIISRLNLHKIHIKFSAINQKSVNRNFDLLQHLLISFERRIQSYRNLTKIL